MIDSHCHIDFAAFDTDRTEVLAAASALGVDTIIVPAVSSESWKNTIKTCQQFSSCHLALGLHPMFIDQHQPQHLTQLNDLVKLHAPIAIGEIGLDYYEKSLDREKQTNYFSKQLVIAKRHQLPLIIHNRKAHDQCIGLLRDYTGLGGVIHAFNGNIAQANKYIEMGFLLGFGGMITYERSRKLRDLLKQLPLNSIALETDAPDMTVERHRGGRNSPEYLPQIAQAVADIKELSVDEIALTTTNNVQRIFNLKPR